MLQTLPALDVSVARSSPQLVVIAVGTPITCELGHAVCVTASDLRRKQIAGRRDVHPLAARDSASRRAVSFLPYLWGSSAPGDTGRHRTAHT